MCVYICSEHLRACLFVRVLDTYIRMYIWTALYVHMCTCQRWHMLLPHKPESWSHHKQIWLDMHLDHCGTVSNIWLSKATCVGAVCLLGLDSVSSAFVMRACIIVRSHSLSRSGSGSGSRSRSRSQSLSLYLSLSLSLSLSLPLSLPLSPPLPPFVSLCMKASDAFI